MSEKTTTEPTVEELKAQLAASQKAEQAAKEESEKAKTIIGQMSEQIAELDAQKSSKYPLVTVEKKKYHVVVPSFKVDGKVVTAADVQKDSALAKKLVKMGSGVLVEVETPKAD